MNEERKTRSCDALGRLNIICIVVSLSTYICNKIILRGRLHGLAGYFCSCYLNDLMSELFFLPVCSIIFACAGRKLKGYSVILALGMAAGAMWEFIAPIINARAVFDPLDLLCYFAGVNVYYLILSSKKG